MKTNVQGLGYMKMRFVHFIIYNNHKHKSIFMNSVRFWLSNFSDLTAVESKFKFGIKKMQ